MGNGFGINNLTVFVGDLDNARSFFTDSLGFFIRNKNTVGDGVFEGTLSLPISLPDMSSIDLISSNDTVSVTGEDAMILDFLEMYKGVRMYSLSTSSVDSTYLWLSSRGVYNGFGPIVLDCKSVFSILSLGSRQQSEI